MFTSATVNVPFRGPLPLLFFDKAFAHDLVDRRLHKRRADGVALPLAFPEVRIGQAVDAPDRERPPPDDVARRPSTDGAD